MYYLPIRTSMRPVFLFIALSSMFSTSILARDNVADLIFLLNNERADAFIILPNKSGYQHQSYEIYNVNTGTFPIPNMAFPDFSTASLTNNSVKVIKTLLETNTIKNSLQMLTNRQDITFRILVAAAGYNAPETHNDPRLTTEARDQAANFIIQSISNLLLTNLSGFTSSRIESFTTTSDINLISRVLLAKKNALPEALRSNVVTGYATSYFILLDNDNHPVDSRFMGITRGSVYSWGYELKREKLSNASELATLAPSKAKNGAGVQLFYLITAGKIDGRDSIADENTRKMALDFIASDAAEYTVPALQALTQSNIGLGPDSTLILVGPYTDAFNDNDSGVNQLEATLIANQLANRVDLYSGIEYTQSVVDAGYSFLENSFGEPNESQAATQDEPEEIIQTVIEVDVLQTTTNQSSFDNTDADAQTLLKIPMQIHQPLLKIPVQIHQPLLKIPVQIHQPLLKIPVQIHQPLLKIPMQIHQPLLKIPV